MACSRMNFTFTSLPYTSVSQTFFKWGPLLLVRMFYGPPYSCPLWKQIEILSYSVWYAIHVDFIFSVFFGLMFNLRGPQGQNPRTTCGPRTTVWETLPYTILRINGWDMIKTYICLHVKYPLFLSDVNENWFFLSDFLKTLKYQIS
jgi:hypothetical protein